MKSAFLLLTGSSLLALVACSAAPEPSSGVCEANPETGVAPRFKSKQGTSLAGDHEEGQGTSLDGQVSHADGKWLPNGKWLQNGQMQNGATLNGVSLEKAGMNGAELRDVILNGTELVGTSVRGEAFVGAELDGVTRAGDVVRLKITAFERDAEDARLVRYAVERDGRNVCGEGEKGIFVPGVWDERAGFSPATEASGKKLSATFSCPAGVIAKCVTWGYRPWTVGAELHQTCTRMARADYCGDGVSHTKNGTLIDVFDDKGVQVSTRDPAFQFEAAWGPNGATCVSRTRYEAKTTSGKAVLPSCWSSLPKCDDWSDARGALMGNGSKIQSRTLCE